MDLHLQRGDAHRVEQLALILVQTLDLHVHDGVGVERHAVVAPGKGREAALVLVLDLLHAAQHLRIVGKGVQLAQALGLEQIGVVAQQLADQAVQAGVDLAEPAAVVDAVGHIGEAVGADGVEVGEEVALDDVAVQARHAVDLIAGGEAEVGHVHLTVADDHVAAHALALAEVVDQEVDPALVDLAHDLPQARQQLLDQILRPLLQGLAHDGVVGVGHAVAHDLPALVPAEAVLVHQQAHQLGDDHGRVGVVDLDDVVLGEAAHVAPLGDVLAQDVLGAGGDEEILLLEAQGLALDMIVGGIEHLGDDLGHRALLHALDVLALGEEVHIQGVGAVRLPEAQGVDALAVVAGDQHVARHGGDGGIAGVLGVIAAGVVPDGRDLAAEAHLHRVLIAGAEPALHRAAPVVGHLGLPAAGELLLEDAELIAERVARGLHAERGQAVHIAGGQTAEAAVAEARVGLGLENIHCAAAHVRQRAGNGVGNAQVEGVLHQAAAHEELHGHVMDFFLAALRILRYQQAAHDLADHNGGRLEDLVVGGRGAGDGEMGAQLVLNGAAHLVA